MRANLPIASMSTFGRCLSALVGCSLLGLFTSTSHAANWIKVQSPDVIVYTDASPSEATDLAVGFAGYRQVMRKVFSLSGVQAPARVLLYRHPSDLVKYGEPKTYAYSSLSWTWVGSDLMDALAVQSEPAETLYDLCAWDTERTLHRLGYDAELAIWMQRALEAVLSSTRVEKGQVVLGKGPDYLSNYWTGSSAWKWNEYFVSNPPAEWSQKDVVLQLRYRAQAWALMHRILVENPVGAPKLWQLADRWRAQPNVAAVEAVLGIPANQIDQELGRHFHASQATFSLPFDASAAARECKVEPAPEMELEIAQADLMNWVGRKDLADAHLARATAAAPESPFVKEAKARSAFFRQNMDEMVRFYREAITAGSTNPAAYMQSLRRRAQELGIEDPNNLLPAARSLSATRRAQDLGTEEGRGGEPELAALADARRLVQLDPAFPEAYILLGQFLTVVPTVTEENIAELNPGVRERGNAIWVRYYRAVLYSRLHRGDESLAELKALAGDEHASAKLRAAAEARIHVQRFRAMAGEVHQLIESHDFAGARQTVLQSGFEPGPTLDELSDQIAEAEAFEAVRSAQADEKWADVGPAAEKFLAQFPNSKLAIRVHRMVANAKTELNSGSN